MNDFFKDTNNICYFSGLHKWPSEGHDTPAKIIQPAEAVLRPVRGTVKHLDNTVPPSQKTSAWFCFSHSSESSWLSIMRNLGFQTFPPRSSHRLLLSLFVSSWLSGLADKKTQREVRLYRIHHGQPGRGRVREKTTPVLLMPPMALCLFKAAVT